MARQVADGWTRDTSKAPRQPTNAVPDASHPRPRRALQGLVATCSLEILRVLRFDPAPREPSVARSRSRMPCGQMLARRQRTAWTDPGSMGCRGRRPERGQQLRSHELSDRDRAAHIADRVLHVAGRLLAIVELLAVQIDLEPTLSNRRQGDANFAVTPGANLSCQTGSLPEVSSSDAVQDLQLYLAFGHV